MANRFCTYAASIAVAGGLLYACTPMGDLDAAASGHTGSVQGGAQSTGGTDQPDFATRWAEGGSRASAKGSSEPNTGDAMGGSSGQLSYDAMGGDPGSTSGDRTGVGGGAAAEPTGTAGSGAAGAERPAVGAGGLPRHGTNGSGNSDLNAGGSSLGAGGASGRAGQREERAGAGGTSTREGGAGEGGMPQTILSDLPDIVDSPVIGEIAYSQGASWDIDGIQQPAFEIHTPTANYWLVKSAAAIVSITDSSGVQWINFSSGFRPNRGVPNLGGCCQPGDPSKLGLPKMSTVIDSKAVATSTHLRLISTSADGDSYRLVWDFFLTHFTLTIVRASAAFGFTYRGAPGGSLGASDQLVLSSGATRSVTVPYSADLPGPSEWAYFAKQSAGQSLYLIQHTDDTRADTYQIADGDTAMFVFGGGQITDTPIRFSLGLVNSSEEDAVRKRIAFVVSAIR